MIEGIRTGRHTELFRDGEKVYIRETMLTGSPRECVKVIEGIDQGDHYEFRRGYNCCSTMSKTQVEIYFMPATSKAAGQPGQQEPTA